MSNPKCNYCGSLKTAKLSDFFKEAYKDNAYQFYACKDCGKVTMEFVPP